MWGAMGEAPRGRVTHAGARCWSFEGGDGRGRGGRPRAAMNVALCRWRRHQLVVDGLFDGGRRHGRGLPSPPVWLSGDRGGRSRGGWLCPFTRSGRARRTFPHALAASAAAAAAVAGAAAAGRGPLGGTGATKNEGDSTAVGEARVWPRQRLVLSHRHPTGWVRPPCTGHAGRCPRPPPPYLFSPRPPPAAAGVVLLASSRGGGRAPRPLAPAPAFFFPPPPLLPLARARARGGASRVGRRVRRPPHGTPSPHAPPDKIRVCNNQPANGQAQRRARARRDGAPWPRVGHHRQEDALRACLHVQGHRFLILVALKIGFQLPRPSRNFVQPGSPLGAPDHD